MQALLIQRHVRKSRDACRLAVHATGRDQVAPTTLTSSPERSGADSCTRMPGGHFHVILSRTDEQPCNRRQTEARSTSPSRRSTSPSRRRSRSTRTKDHLAARNAPGEKESRTRRSRRSSSRSTSSSRRRSRRSTSPSRNTVWTAQADRSTTWNT